MMLLGGSTRLFGPLLGAAAFTWLQDALARATEYWRAGVGIVILLIVSVFPFGIGGAATAWLPRLPHVAMSAPLLVVDALSKSFGGVHARARRLVRRRTRGDRRDHRPERRRQDDVLQPDPRRSSHRIAATFASTAATLLRKPPHAIAHRGVGRTFQVAATFASMTVRESVALALVARDGTTARRGADADDAFRSDRRAARRGCASTISPTRHCAALAYGDAKRLELALALALRRGCC